MFDSFKNYIIRYSCRVSTAIQKFVGPIIESASATAQEMMTVVFTSTTMGPNNSSSPLEMAQNINADVAAPADGNEIERNVYDTGLAEKSTGRNGNEDAIALTEKIGGEESNEDAIVPTEKIGEEESNAT